ncbi:hypothetical protein Sjap_016524 [Stephania japonica]|uniref:Uncharacterized protein n=1 Tax=Stephania japonica TaxID=461633 RepID=A0AAP0NRX7_9MAGN
MRASRDHHQQSRVLYDLCCLLLDVLPCSSSSAASPPPRRSTSPAAFASLLLGVSLALMLCGSVTFLIGFMLMPWVLGMLTVFYLVGVVSNLSGLGRAILWPPTGKEMTDWNF